MKKVRSSISPQLVEFTPNKVLVASNIHTYEEEMDGHILRGYEYDCEEYTKDEYLLLQNNKIAVLEEELNAAKILLGVE